MRKEMPFYCRKNLLKWICIVICTVILTGTISIHSMAYEISAAATNDYTQWKQTSSSWGEATPWPKAPIPKFGDAGCWITSVAILLRHYNIVTESNVNVFNPLVCNNRLMDYGIVDAAGDFCNLNRMNIAFPGFEYAGTVAYSLAKLQSLYNQGYACIVFEKRGNGHYVAVRNVSGSSAIVMDPGYSTTALVSPASIQYYRVSGMSNGGGSISNNPNSNPEGCLDSVTSNTPGTITLKGWAFDRSSLGTSLEIHVYVGGAYNGSALYGTSIRADKVRGDVNNVYPGVGNNHGFDETINVPVSPGTYPVYVYAINVGGSTGSNYNTCLGSKTVTIKSDSTPPEIYDVRVTDLNESGYTVTCTVTDDQDVNRVQFPTWTAMNDQDDIDGNWWSSERSRGRRNGNNYTFRVNISDHNNEFGVYYTHIYAFDSAGNYKSVCVDGQVVSKYSANPGRTINDGVYSIRSSVDSGFELAVNGNSNEAGANIYLWSRDVQNPYHRFKFTYKADGYYLITNMGSGLALDVCGVSSANNTNIMQFTVHGDSNQLFRIYPDGNNAYYIVPKNAPYSCIDLANGNASNGNNIQLFQENHSNAQRWYLSDYSTGGSNSTVETPEESEEIEQVVVKPKETVLISLKNSRSKKLQVKWKRNSNVNGYKVQIATNSVFSNSVTYTVNGNKTTSKIFNVKKGKTYWVRICTYRGDMISNWSKAKKIKIRK